VITKEQARTIAKRVVNEGYAIEDDELEMLDDLTIEKNYGWIFFYDSRRHIETKDDRFLLAGNGPILVRKADGSVREFGTARPLDYYIAEYERELSSGVG
jgi:hypothetical protein